MQMFLGVRRVFHSKKFLFHCLQIPAGAHVQIMGEPISAVEVKMLTSQTRRTKSFARNKNLGYEGLLFAYFSL